MTLSWSGTLIYMRLGKALVYSNIMVGLQINPTGLRMGDNMKKFIIFLFLPLLISCVHASEHYPGDVTQYLKNAENCQYFSGEWDSDLPIARQREIEKNVNEACSKAKAEQRHLRVKYRDEQRLLKVINGYEL